MLTILGVVLADLSINSLRLATSYIPVVGSSKRKRKRVVSLREAIIVRPENARSLPRLTEVDRGKRQQPSYSSQRSSKQPFHALSCVYSEKCNAGLSMDMMQEMYRAYRPHASTIPLYCVAPSSV